MQPPSSPPIPPSNPTPPKWVKTCDLDAETVAHISRGISPKLWDDYPQNGQSMQDFDAFVLDCVRAFQNFIHHDTDWDEQDYWVAIDDFCEAVVNLFPSGLMGESAEGIARLVSQWQNTPRLERESYSQNHFAEIESQAVVRLANVLDRDCFAVTVKSLPHPLRSIDETIVQVWSSSSNIESKIILMLDRYSFKLADEISCYLHYESNITKQITTQDQGEKEYRWIFFSVRLGCSTHYEKP